MNKLHHNFFIDLDGTVANFDKLAHEIIGKDIGIGGRIDDEGDLKLIDDYRNFYFHLEPMSYAKDLVEFVRKHFSNVCFLTALPSRFQKEAAMRDKGNWGRKYFPDIPMIFTETGLLKAQYAKNFDCSPAILLDDKKYVIENFEKFGGYGILHHDYEDTLNQLESLIIALKCGENLNHEGTFQKSYSY